MKKIFFIGILFFSENLLSQNISGEWLGEIFIKDKKDKYILFFPIAIDLTIDSLDNNSYTGFSTTKSFDSVIVECTLTGTYNYKKGIYTLTETSTISSSISLKNDLPFSVLNRFNLSFADSTRQKLTGTCDCLQQYMDPLCDEKLKIELRRLPPPK